MKVYTCEIGRTHDLRCPYCGDKRRLRLHSDELIAFCLTHEYSESANLSPFLTWDPQIERLTRNPILFRKYFYTPRGVEVWEP